MGMSEKVPSENVSASVGLPMQCSVPDQRTQQHRAMNKTIKRLEEYKSLVYILGVSRALRSGVYLRGM